MSIQNPTTYAEWYWAQQVDAKTVLDDEYEAILKPHVDRFTDLARSIDGFPPEITAMLSAFGTPGHAALSGIGQGMLAQTAGSGLTVLLGPQFRKATYRSNTDNPNAIIEPDVVSALFHRKKAVPELFDDVFRAYGYPEEQAALAYEALLPYPDINDWIRYLRYTNDDVSLYEEFSKHIDIRADEFTVWEWLNKMFLGTRDIQSLFVRGYMGREDAELELRRNGWRDLDIGAMLDLAYSYPNPTISLQAALLREQSGEDLLGIIQRGGVHPDHAQDYLDALLAKPNPQDIIRWRLRTDPELNDLDSDLYKLGIHPSYIDVFRTLAYPVPPIQDIITMAVREAFSPAIASRFGQYEDYPDDLTKFAAMNGISEDWAKRYWASHWSLPSPQQGFEMLHRGVINRDELNLLLRALDVMPFWREKLVQISFKPLTRVDVRRMYGLGVIDEQEVLQAYKDIGYADENARRMADFTVKQVLASQTGFNSTDVVTAYKNDRVGRPEAFSMLAELGIKDQNITSILNAAETQREWTLLQDRIKAIHNLYNQDKLTIEEAKAELRKLRLSGEKVDALGESWYRETVSRVSTPWTAAQTLQMLQRDIISGQRAVSELKLLGYDTEHINALVANARYVKPKNDS